MSISRQNLSIVIVTFKSEAVIHECIKSIDKDIKITVVENSNNFQFKDELEKSYKNVYQYQLLSLYFLDNDSLACR